MPVIVVLLAVSNVFLLMTDHLAGKKSGQVILGQDLNYCELRSVKIDNSTFND